MSGDPPPIKSTWFVRAAKLKTWASPGHDSKLVSTTPLASFHASCGVKPTVWHCPCQGFLPSPCVTYRKQ